MPRAPNPVPTYRLHKQSGQAVVTIFYDRRRRDGRRGVSLGRSGSPHAAGRSYARSCAEAAAAAGRAGGPPAA